MITSSEIFIESLGTEPFEIFGFQTEEELESALLPLLEEVNLGLES